MGRWVWWMCLGLVACSGGSKGGGDDDDDDDDDDDNPAEVDLTGLCQRVESCNGEATDECVDSVEEAIDAAIDSGCGREFLGYLRCFEQQATCVSGTFEAVCNSEVNDYFECMYSRDSGYYYYGDDDDDYTYTVPYTFEASVDCPSGNDAGDPIALWIQASVDNGSRGIIDMADTVAISSWYESHELLPTFSANGITEFEASLTSGDGASLNYNNGVSSTFMCAAHIDAGSQVMTYVVRAYDAGGSLWDCFAEGQDPAGLLSGDYENWGNGISDFDVNTADCAINRRAR